MSTLAEVRLWGRRIAAVALDTNSTLASFEWDAEFLTSGIEVAPLTMPLSTGVFSFPELERITFHGLPGLLADSLPDRFGNALIDAWLATQGRSPHSMNAIERLCYSGSRGMGALEFRPLLGSKSRKSSPIYVDRLVDLASEILSNRDALRVSIEDPVKEEALRDILQVGTSAGGARAKAVVAWNPGTNELRSGQVPAEDGFESWLMKFDGVQSNRDKEMADPMGYGAIEFAYHKMARAAGITMADCRLLDENGRRHFMTRRFDREATGGKLHMQSLCAMAHYDFNRAGVYGYEQALQVMRRLGLSMAAIEEQFRRMAFNIIGRNQDDHVKNIAFLMDRSGQWSLSPAFDMTYSFQPTGKWTSRHQMTLNGKQDFFTLADFMTCAQTASMKRGRAQKILQEVRDAFLTWRDVADEVGVLPTQRDKIQATLRLEPFA
jgi:serine/threonine-protein kinase HipA